jgi:8-oxo-dGTP pyrophosphatase MutT (NUDIX family)
VGRKRARTSVAAAALIVRRAEGRPEWLVRWNTHWKRYHFVGGHKHDRESFLGCIRREIAEELGLRAGSDFSVRPRAVRHLKYSAWSRSAKVPTDYEVKLFAAVLRGRRAEEALEREDVRWAGAAEIRAGRCADARPLSRTARRFLDAARWPATPESF